MQVEKNKDNILPKLLIGANQTNHDALFKEELKKYDPLKVCPHLPRKLVVLLEWSLRKGKPMILARGQTWRDHPSRFHSYATHQIHAHTRL